MSLRLRLALWYGGLTGLVVFVVGLLTYAAHTRGHYDEMDYTLYTSAEHIAQEYELGGASLPPVGAKAPISQSLAVRIYDPAGGIVGESSAAGPAPDVDPAGTLAAPPGPPFDPVAAIAPPMAAPSVAVGAFGLSEVKGGDRWRYYVRPFLGSRYYLVVAESLARLDASVAQFRWLVALLTLGGAAITLAAGWLLARRALRPVSSLQETAATIAHSRNFQRRVRVGSTQDELGKLASTFNEMLASLEEAYHAQQRFVSDASHELRAPLTAIQGNLDLLERIPNMPPEERQEAIGEASREARRLARLVADLLALARADAGVATRRDPVELDRSLLEAMGSARHLARGQRLEVSEVEPVVVLGDQDRLKQLFLLLLDNAIKYTPSGGSVTAGLRRDEGYAEINVVDTGIGIAPEDLPNVFDRFYRADPARGRDPGGTGLGLPIAKWIVEQHRGEIAISSKQGRGTTVTLRFPLTS